MPVAAEMLLSPGPLGVTCGLGTSYTHIGVHVHGLVS